MTFSILFIVLLFQFVTGSEIIPEDQEITTMPTETALVLGRTVLLSCHIKRPIEECTWEINGIPRTERKVIEQKIFRSETFAKCIIEIEAITYADFGSWTCNLTDNEGIKRSSVITLSMKTPYGLYTILVIGLILILGYGIGCTVQKKFDGAKWKPTTTCDTPYSENHSKIALGRHPSLTASSSNKSEVFDQPYPQTP